MPSAEGGRGCADFDFFFFAPFAYFLLFSAMALIVLAARLEKNRFLVGLHTESTCRCSLSVHSQTGGENLHEAYKSNSVCRGGSQEGSDLVRKWVCELVLRFRTDLTQICMC